jgi:hypothetical protein
VVKVIVILQTEIEVSGIPDNWNARKEAKWTFFKQLMNAPKKEQWKIVDRMSASIYEKPPEPISYMSNAENDAKMLITDYFMDEIIEKIIGDGKASDDINNDYHNGDGIFHETIVDQDYSSEDAIELLSELYRYEEEDSGLWEGQEWDRILATKAAFTYGNAVYDKWNDLIMEINEIDIEYIENKAVRQILKWMYKKTLTKDDREQIYIDKLAWVEETFTILFDDILRTLIEKEITEIID